MQGVKQGVGVIIAADGTISFDSTSATGVMRLNNPSAFNGYVWPSGGPFPNNSIPQYTSGTGLINWTVNYVPTTGATGAAQLPVGVIAQRPLPPSLGQIRYNSETGALEFYDGFNWVSVLSVGPTPSPNPTIGLGLAVSGTAIKLSVPIQFGPPAAGTLPAEAIPGSLYWDDNLGLLFIYYYDGSSYQWVQVTPSGGGGGGGTGTVTSVGITGTQGIGVVSGSPVTSAGNITLAIDLATLPPIP